MNLVFKEYIKFLNDKGIDTDKYNLKEGYFWFNKSIIKAYGKDGNLYKILRLAIDDDLNISVKTVYKNKPFEIESWEETVKRNESRLKELESESKELIRMSIDKYNNLKPTILSSGGKDSSVVTYLTRSVAPNTEIIFSNTTLDCADTYLHIKKESNVKIINPKEGFYQWRDRLNFVPTRFTRACCDRYKEGAMITVLNSNDKYLFFMGMRNSESNTRSSYGDEWRNKKWGNKQWQGILPIRQWSEEDIWLYIIWRGIDINSKYKKGYSRVGCAVACPFYNKSTWVLDKYWYEHLFNRWRDILHKDFINNNKDLIMNCTSDEYNLCWNGGVYRDTPTEKVVSEFAQRNNLNIEVAEKYFNHRCEDCNKRIKSKEVIGMNLKFNGRNTNKFFCKNDLMKRLNIDENQWRSRIDDFKNQKCLLF